MWISIPNMQLVHAWQHVCRDETVLSVGIIEMLSYSPWIYGFDIISIFKCKFKQDVTLQNNLLIVMVLK